MRAKAAFDLNPPGAKAPALGSLSLAGAVPGLPAGELDQLARELQMARRIQHSFLPKKFPQMPGFEVAAFYRSAGEVGGDFYDAVPLASGQKLFIIADVMGKGVPAAMFAASLRTILRTLAQSTESPGDLLARANRQLFAELSAVDMFITVQLVVLDPVRLQLKVASAGHCPLLLRTPGGEVRQTLAPEGVPLGVMAEAVYIENELSLEPGVSLLLYTDGVTDACGADGNIFNQQRLESWLCSHGGASFSAAELKEKLSAQLTAFQSSAALRDDQSFLLITHRPGLAVTEAQKSNPVGLACVGDSAAPIAELFEEQQTRCGLSAPESKPPLADPLAA